MPDWNILLIIAGFFAFSNLVILTGTITVKLTSTKRFKSKQSYTDDIEALVLYGTHPGNLAKKRLRLDFLIQLASMLHTVTPTAQGAKGIETLLDKWNVRPLIRKFLCRRTIQRRTQAVSLTILFRRADRTELLSRQLLKEQFIPLRLHIAYMLCMADISYTIGILLESMESQPPSYRRKVINFMSSHRRELDAWAEKTKYSDKPHIQQLLIEASKSGRYGWYSDMLLKLLAEGDSDIKKRAAGVYFSQYENSRQSSEITLFGDNWDKDVSVLEASIRGKDLPQKEVVRRIAEYPETRQILVSELIARLNSDPRLASELLVRYESASTEEERLLYASALTVKIEYFLRRFSEDEAGVIRELIDDAIEIRQTSGIIRFLNESKNDTAVSLLLDTIAPRVEQDEHFRNQCRLYLDDVPLEKLGLSRAYASTTHDHIGLSGKDRRFMILLLAGLTLAPILSYVIRFMNRFAYMNGQEYAVTFIMHNLALLAAYAMAANLFSLTMIISSWKSITDQRHAWSNTHKDILNARGMLPSVSILAPAYNEEKTVVQNVQSLLSLGYPEFEVIVINDGSTDETESRMIEYFDMHLSDDASKPFMPTAPVSGIYVSKTSPNLKLVSKSNGGKADSLNAGINIAKGEYLCTIDADSILEPDALTKVMFRTVISKKDVIAVGGNVIPVNGSVVENGSVKEKHLPGGYFARYQTIEYLRSFMIGRLGWAKLNGLLIISGAFGVFKRSAILEIGGYMTGKSLLRRDTVGEDMEIVMRLIERFSKDKKPFKIDYAYNGNCWTEVPDSYASLMKQRDRWQRGLIENLLFHKKMFLDPRYRTAGLFSVPYYFTFEVVGPFWELAGYIILAIALAAGLVSRQVFLLMYLIVIHFGVLISGMSLYLAEKQVVYFKGREFASSLLTSFAENFGFRQYMSFSRPFSYLSMLFTNKGWQKLDRTGFMEKRGGSEKNK